MAMKQKPDMLKIRITIRAAIRAVDKLEDALDRNDQRTVGSALYEIRRELHLLKTETEDDQKEMM